MTQRLWMRSLYVLLLLMIMVGGITRLTGSGLSMVEWKPLTLLPPASTEAWQQEFEHYKHFPEYKKVYTDISLHEFKNIYWVEYIHRSLGRFIGLFFFVPFLFFFKSFSRLQKTTLILFGLSLSIQGFLGWYMVKSGLIHEPHVSPYRLTLHFFFSLILIALMLWALFPSSHRRPSRTFYPACFLLFLQILTASYGALVAGHKAGLIYNTFPLMGDAFIPSEFGFYQPLWRDLTNNAATVQFIHRTLAMGTFLGVLLFQTNKTWMLFTALQVLLGIFTLLHHVPLTLGVLHQLWGVLTISIGFWHVYGIKPHR